MKLFRTNQLILASCLSTAALVSACGPRAPSSSAASPTGSDAEADKPKLEPLAEPADLASWKLATPEDPKFPLALKMPGTHWFKARQDSKGRGGITAHGKTADGVEFSVEIFPTQMKTMEEVKKDGYIQKLVREEDDLAIFKTISGYDTDARVIHKEGDTLYVCSNKSPLKEELAEKPRLAGIAACRTLTSATDAVARTPVSGVRAEEATAQPEAKPKAQRVVLADFGVPLSIEMPAEAKKERLDFPDAKGVWIKGGGVMVRVFPVDKDRSTVAAAKTYLTTKARGRVKASEFVKEKEEADLLVWNDGVGELDFMLIAKHDDKTYACQGTAKAEELAAEVAVCRSLQPAK